MKKIKTITKNIGELFLEGPKIMDQYKHNLIESLNFLTAIKLLRVYYIMIDDQFPLTDFHFCLPISHPRDCLH